MDIWVVKLFGTLESVWSTEQKAQIQVEALNRDSCPEAEYQRMTVNYSEHFNEPPKSE